MNKNTNCCCKTIRAIAHLNIQYAHRFYGFKGEAQYLHGHTGGLTLEVGARRGRTPFCVRVFDV